jgi:multiple sugar transport system permease protein
MRRSGLGMESSRGPGASPMATSVTAAPASAITTTTTTAPTRRGRSASRSPSASRPAGLPHRSRAKRAALHATLVVVALLFLTPILWAAFTSLRTYADTAVHGYLSVPKALTFSNFTGAWSQGDIPKYFLNTLIILVPSVILILLLASYVAFAIARVNIRGSKLLFIAAAGASILPPQVLITALFKLYIIIPLPTWLNGDGLLYDSYLGVILVQVATQMGFCVFVLTNFMRRIPEEITEAALLDGASAWRQYWSVTLPLCRPALAALATLEFTWIYNDFFWALMLMSSGDKQPITTALNNLKDQFFTNNNLLAAGSLIIALPTMIVYFIAQRQFVNGLTMGATKG